MGIFFETTDKINNILSYACTFLMGLAIFFNVTKYLFKSIKGRGWLQGSLLTFILIGEYVLGIGVALGLALQIPKLIPLVTFASVVWGEIYIVSLFYFQRRKHSRGPSVYSVLLNLVILNAGWFADRWLGMLFFSAPLLFIFNYFLQKIALVTVPASNPDDKKERRQRRNVFLSYVFGLQMPLWNVNGVNVHEIEKRVDGSPFPNLAAFPGIIKTYSHQVVGIANGISFRVEGPGVIFTSKGDQPFEVIDLRTQNRSSTIRAFSKEGIPFIANVSITFKIDCDEWSPSVFHDLSRSNLIFANKGRELDRNLDGLFPYSSVRIKAALYFRSKTSEPNGEIERWDDHVLAIAEEAAREILAEHPLIELWNLESPNVNALDEIARQMKMHIENSLRARGILVISAKTSPDFSDKKEFAEKDRDVKEKVIKQQIATWSVERERERKISQTDTEITAERIEQEARVYAHSALLTAIADGLQFARARDPNMVRYIIALRYVGALESMVDQQPYDSNDEEQQNARLNIHKTKRHLLSHTPRE